MLGLYHVCILQVCKDPSMELANFIFFGSLHGSVAYASIDELLPKARVVDKNLFPSCEVLFRVPKTGRIFWICAQSQSKSDWTSWSHSTSALISPHVMLGLA